METIYLVFLIMVAVAVVTGLVSTVLSVSKRPFWVVKAAVPASKPAVLAAARVKVRASTATPAAHAEAGLAA